MPPFAGIPRTQLDTMKASKLRWRFAPLWLLSTLTELSLVRWFIQRIPSLDRIRVTLRAMRDGRKVVGWLANGETVWSGLDKDHLIAHPDVIPHLYEALRAIVLDPTLRITRPFLHDFGHPVGHSACVPTTETDEIVYVRRTGRKLGCSRMVKGREPIPCSSLVVILHRNAYGVVALMTAYFGTLAPAEPCSKTGQATLARWEESVRFWREHALIYTGNHDPNFGVRSEEPEYWRPPAPTS